jgi:hypothetical protein
MKGIYICKFKFILAISLVAILSSCSDNTNSNNSTASDSSKTKTETQAPTATACQLLKMEDAEAILGNKVSQGMSTESMCQYLSTAEELAHAGESVSLTFQKGAASEFDNYVAKTAQDMNVKTEPVTGIGDKAAWTDGSLIVAKGSDLLVVMVGKKMQKEQHIDAAKSLTQKIISRM